MQDDGSYGRPAPNTDLRSILPPREKDKDATADDDGYGLHMGCDAGWDRWDNSHVVIV
jgi:hypothetical protein